jgi:hypothetical protein
VSPKHRAPLDNSRRAAMCSRRLIDPVHQATDPRLHPKPQRLVPTTHTQVRRPKRNPPASIPRGFNTQREIQMSNPRISESSATRAAPPQHCSRCGRKIGSRRLHAIPHRLPMVVVCTSCFGHPDAHRELYPRCTHHHHDAADHGVVLCSRARARRIISRHSAFLAAASQGVA